MKMRSSASPPQTDSCGKPKEEIISFDGKEITFKKLKISECAAPLGVGLCVWCDAPIVSLCIWEVPGVARPPAELCETCFSAASIMYHNAGLSVYLMYVARRNAARRTYLSQEALAANNVRVAQMEQTFNIPNAVRMVPANETAGPVVKCKQLKRFDREMFEHFLEKPGEYELCTKAKSVSHNFVAANGAVHGKEGRLVGVTTLRHKPTKNFMLMKGEYPISVRDFHSRVVVLERESSSRVVHKMLDTGDLPLNIPWVGEFFRIGWRANTIKKPVLEASATEWLATIAPVLGFVHALWTRNKVQILAYLAARLDLAMSLVDELSEESVAELIDRMVPPEGEPVRVPELASASDDCDAVELSGMMVREVAGGELPTQGIEGIEQITKRVHATGWIRDMQRLVAVVTGQSLVADFCKDKPRITAFLSLLSLEPIVTTSGIFVMAISVIKQFSAAVKRVTVTHNPLDLFSFDDEAGITAQVIDLCAVDIAKVGAEGVKDAMRKIHELKLRAQYGRFDSFDWREAKKKASERFVAWENQLCSTNVKEMTSVVWLTGPPGTGKTILIETILNLYAKANGFVRFPGDTLMVSTESKFPGEMQNADSNESFAVFNDLSDNHSQDLQQGKPSMSGMLQVLIDVIPGWLDHPVAEKKGRRMRNLKLVVITTNHENMVFSSDVEKLVRRISRGFTAQIAWDKDKLAQLAGGVSDEHQQKVRDNPAWLAQCIQITPLKIVAHNQRLAAELEQWHYSYANFLHHFELWLEQDRERRRKSFLEITAYCSRGASKMLHYRVENGKTVLRPCCDDCVMEANGAVKETLTVVGDKIVRGARYAAYGVALAVHFAVGFVLSVNYWSMVIIFAGAAPLWFFKCVEVLSARFLALFDDVLTTALRYGNFRKAWKKIAGEWSLLRVSTYVHTKKLVKALQSSWSRSEFFYTMVLSTSAMAIYGLYHWWFSADGSQSEKVSGVAETKKEVGGSFSVFKDTLKSDTVPLIETRQQAQYPPSEVDQWRKLAGTMRTGVVELVTKGGAIKDIARLFRSQQFRCKIYFEGHVFEVIVTVWNSLWLSIPRHSLLDRVNSPFNQKMKEFDIVVENNGVSERKTFRGEDWRVLDECDVALHPNTLIKGVAKDLTNYLPRKMDVNRLDGQLWLDRCDDPQSLRLERLDQFYQPKDHQKRLDIFMSKGSVEPGDCGNVLLSSLGNDGQAFVAGIVTLRVGNGECIGFTLFMKQHFDAMISTSVGGVLIPVAHDQVFDFDLSAIKPLVPNSVLREDGLVRIGILPMGSVACPTATFRTKLVPTKMLEDLANSGLLKKVYCPPKHLKRYDEDGGYRSAMNNMFGAKAPGNAPIGKYFEAIREYLQHLQSLTAKANLSPLTFTQAFFGDPEIGLDPMNKDASNGGTWNFLGMKTKLDLIDQEQPGFKKVFQEACEKMLSQLQAGELPVMKCHVVPKDELREKSKIDDCKIRLFTTLDVEVNVILRAYMAPLFKVLLDNPTISRIYAKMNAASPMWHKLFSSFKGLFCGDGDFEKYDVNHDKEAFVAFAVFMYMFAKACKYSEAEAVIVFRLCMLASAQVCIYAADVFFKFDGMPSGAFFTLMFNSVVNVLLHMVVWKDLEGTPFFQNVLIAVVGDDNVWGVKNPKNWDVPNVIARLRKYGYPATPGSKTGDVRKYVPLEELVFLKRRADERDGVFYAPLEKDSLYKAFMWRNKGSPTPEIQRSHDMFLMFQRECFLHADGDEMIATLMPIFEKHYGSPQMLDKDQLQREYESGMLMTHWSLASGTLRRQSKSIFWFVVAACFMLVAWRGLAARLDISTAAVWPDKHLRASYASTAGLVDSGEDPASVKTNGALSATLLEFMRSKQEDNRIAQNQGINTAPVGAPSADLGQNAHVVAPNLGEERRVTAGHYDIMDSEYPDFISQPVQLAHFLWVAAGTAGTSYLDIDDVFKEALVQAAGTPLASRINNFSRVRCKLHIRVVVQGAPQLAGSLIISADPSKQSMPVDVFNFANRVNCSNVVNQWVVPHVVVDPAVSQSYEMVLPMTHFLGFYRSKLNHGSWRLRARVVNPIRSGTAVSGTVSVCIYAAFKDIEVDGMTTVVAGEIKRVGEPENSGKVSGVAHSVANVAESVSENFPALSPVASVIGGVASAAGSVLSWLGFGKPPIADVQLPMLTRTTDAYSHNRGVTTAQILGANQEHALSIDPEFGGGKLEDLSLSKLASIPGLVTQDATITTALAAFARVPISWPVTPMLVTSATGQVQPTPLAGVSFPHKFWRGDITLHFEFVASTFQRATVLIAWDPNIANDASAPTFDAALTSLKNTTVQICGRTQVDITIPWRQIASAEVVGGFVDTSMFVNVEEINGRVFMWIINPVSANGGTDPIGFNVFITCPNISLSLPTQGKYGNWTPVIDSVPAPSLLKEVEGMAIEEASGAITKVSFGEDKSDKEQMFMRALGETSRSIRDVISRHNFLFRADMLTTTSGYNLSNIAVRFLNYPMFRYAGQSVGTNYPIPVDAGIFAAYFPMGKNVMEMTHLAWFSNAFNGIRGSLYWSASMQGQPIYSAAPGASTNLSFGQNGTNIMEHHVHAKMAVGASSGRYINYYGDIANLNDPVMDTGEAYSYVIANNRVTGRLDGIAPMMAPYGLVPAGAIWSEYTDMLRVRPTVPPMNVQNMRFDCTVSSGDDYTLVFFRGFPTVILTNQPPAPTGP